MVTDVSDKERNSGFPILPHMQIRVDNVCDRPLAYDSIEPFHPFDLSKANGLNSELLAYHRD